MGIKHIVHQAEEMRQPKATALYKILVASVGKEFYGRTGRPDPSGCNASDREFRHGARSRQASHGFASFPPDTFRQQADERFPA
jgi:hypothetical protein